MRFAAVLNREGGKLRTTDLDTLSARMTEVLEAAGHTVEIEIVSGKELVGAIDRACSGPAEIVLVGGGDGTVSAAAGALMDSDKALAILPAGTMNLFARSLAIPLSPDAAIKAFADGKVRAVDIATANGQPFIHQFSIGMHAKMVHLRDRMEFASRWGKIRASMHATWETIMNPPALDLSLALDGTEMLVRTTALGVTNNLFGEGHLPYTDQPDGGVLGIYVTIARDRGDLIRYFFKVARGKWRDNEHVEIHQAKQVVVKLLSKRTRLRAAIDGELCELARETEIRIHAGALRVLAPAPAAQAV